MSLTAIRRACEPALRKIFHLYWRFSRGMTLGVRAVVFDGAGGVFLVKHSYVHGWYLPGGGVEVGQTMIEALRRELREEGNITLTSEPVLHGVFLNDHVSIRDHVAVYVVRAFAQAAAPAPNREIVETGFFLPDALPPDTTEGTRARICEVTAGIQPAATWRTRR